MAGRAVGPVGARGQPLDWPRFPRPALCRGRRRRGPGGLLLGEPVQEQVARRRIEPANAGDKAITLKPCRPWQGRVVDQTVVAAPAPTYPSTRSGGGRYPFLVGLLPRCGLGSSRALAAGREASRPVLLDLCDLYVLRFQ
jgi:hypothetical protein